MGDIRNVLIGIYGTIVFDVIKGVRGTVQGKRIGGIIEGVRSGGVVGGWSGKEGVVEGFGWRGVKGGMEVIRFIKRVKVVLPAITPSFATAVLICM